MSLRANPQEHRQLVDLALQRAEEEPTEAERLFAQAAQQVPPGFERAFVLGQLASLQLSLDRPEQAVNSLLSAQDWPHHVPAAFDTLKRAAVAAHSLEAFRWLATKPGEYHEPDASALDRGVQIALHQKDVEFADQLLTLGSGLYGAEDPLILLLGGLVREKQDRPREAIESYIRSAQEGGSDARTFRRVTLLLDRERRREEAAEWCRRALELDLDAPARQEIEKRLARLQAPKGKKRTASAKVLPLYVSAGDAQIERLATFPVQVTRARQREGTIWGSGSRRGTPHLFALTVGGACPEIPLSFRPTELLPDPDGRCLALGANEGGRAEAGIVAPDGSSSNLTLEDLPSRTIALSDGWLAAYRSGEIERRSWSGETQWRSRIPGEEAYAHFLSADGDLALASFMEGVYEIDLQSGAVSGPARIESQPNTISRGPISIEFSMGPIWVLGLGVLGGNGYVIADDRFFCVSAGPRLDERERLGGPDGVRVPMEDEEGRLLAFQGNDGFRPLLDGRLGASIPCDWKRHNIVATPENGYVTHGGRQIAVSSSNGTETHRLEAAKDVRSLVATSHSDIRTVIGKDVLEVQLR